MPAIKPIIPGERFNRWTALDNSEKRTYASGGRIYFHECRCDCGTVQMVSNVKLRSGWSKSCGCLVADVTAKRNLTHGSSKTRVYGIWCNMLNRCRNPKVPSYPDYGGRGITVCDRWLKFENFLADMGEPPKGLTIDRLNNDGNYELGNCAWRTKIAQARNRRSSLNITIDGLTLPVVEWAARTGINRRTIERRYHAGWSMDRILMPVTQPS